MKNLFLTILMLVILVSDNIATAQAPNWLWARGAGRAAGRSIATDASGNVFVTGSFVTPTITFGTTTLTSAGNLDVYIVKYDGSGNVLWARSFGGTDDDFGYGICTDANGNVNVTGQFNSTNLTVGTTTLGNTGFGDIFIAKYDSSGNVLWAKSAGGMSEDTGYDIASDALGNVIITGFYWGSDISFEAITLSNAGARDIFIAKYNASGIVLWAKTFGSSGDDLSQSISSDSSGNVFITGHFDSPAITFGTTILTGVGDVDVFIVKCEVSGDVIWATSGGGAAGDFGNCISLDASGNVFVTGGFWGSFITFGTDTLTNAGGSDIFIVKYEANGNLLWAKSEGGAGYEGGSAVSTDANGNAFIAGAYQGSAITFGTTTLTNAGYTDIFIVKYDTTGNVLWAKRAGGINEESGFSISTDASGNLFMTGFFESPSINFGATTLTSVSGSDFYIAKLDATITSGIIEQTNYSTMVIAPNPFTSQTTIRFKEEQKNTTIKIIDVLGKEFINLDFNGKQLIIDKGKMQAGIYFLQVITENKITTSKRIAIQ